MLDRKWLYGIVGLAALAIVGAAVGLYVMGSSRIDPARAPSMVQPGSKSPAAPSGTAPTTAPAIDVLADRLAQRLKDNDGTADEWALLARSYVQMQRYPEAVEAFGKAIGKNPGNQAFVDEQAAARKAAGGMTPAK
jgi:cytochrome c-type biogenesis protein CcmH/NrfG